MTASDRDGWDGDGGLAQEQPWQTVERLQIALDASMTGTFRWDARTMELEWDENLERLFGLEPGSSHSVDQLMACMHPDDRSRMVESWWLCVNDGLDLDQEFRVVWPDGSVRWLRDKGRSIPDSDGSPRYLAGACTDVTDHRRIEDELRAQEGMFRTLANTIPQLAWMAETTGRVYWFNQRWLDYTGSTIDEMRGFGWRSVHHPDHVERVVDRLRRSFAAGEPWEDTFPLRGRDGSYRWFLSRALPIHDREGKVESWFGTDTDITDRLTAEQAVQASEAKLRRTIALRDEVLGIVAHDLRNPVHAISMSASSIAELPLTDDQRARQLSVVLRAAQGMDRLISDLLDVTRIESGSFAIERERVDVATLVDELVEMFDAQAHGGGVALRSEVAPNIPQIGGDRHRLAHALSNLVGNALKFTPAGGRVTVRARLVDDSLELAVEDTGSGIPADSLPHVFDRFWQADRASRAGAGLGLAIAKGIAEAHGGSIVVESMVGQGSTFHVRLPATPYRMTDAGS